RCLRRRIRPQWLQAVRRSGRAAHRLRPGRSVGIVPDYLVKHLTSFADVVRSASHRYVRAIIGSKYDCPIRTASPASRAARVGSKTMSRRAVATSRSSLTVTVTAALGFSSPHRTAELYVGPHISTGRPTAV